MDSKDRKIFLVRQGKFLDRNDIRVGDIVKFKNDEIRRVSYVWRDSKGCPANIQTSIGGRYYISDGGHMDFSGGLEPAIDVKHFHNREYILEKASAWFFHHDWHKAHNGVTHQFDVVVWNCDVEV